MSPAESLALERVIYVPVQSVAIRDFMAPLPAGQFYATPQDRVQPVIRLAESLVKQRDALVAALEEALPYVAGWTGAVPLAKSPEQAAKCLTRLDAALKAAKGAS